MRFITQGPRRRSIAPALAGGHALASIAALAQQPAADNVTNPYSPRYQHTYRHGVVPTREAQALMHAWKQANTVPQATGTNTLYYGGGVDGIGVTSGTPKVYIVVYGSQWGTSSTDASGNMTMSNDSVGAVPYL